MVEYVFPLLLAIKDVYRHVHQVVVQVDLYIFGNLAINMNGDVHAPEVRLSHAMMGRLALKA